MKAKTNPLLPKIAQAAKVWLAIYPSITLISFIFQEQLSVLPLYIRTLLLTLVLVPLMVFILLPAIDKTFRFLFNEKT